MFTTAGSSNSLDSQSRKRSFPSDQVDSNTKRVRFDKNSILSSEINISSEPTYDYSQLESNFNALNKDIGKIKVILPSVKQSRINLAKKLPACTVTAVKAKESPFSAAFSSFAQQFSYKNLSNVTDLPKKAGNSTFIKQKQ